MKKTFEKNGQNLCFKVLGISNYINVTEDKEAWSDLINVEMKLPTPAFVSEDSVKVTNRTIDLTWEAVANTIGYELEFDGSNQGIKVTTDLYEKVDDTTVGKFLHEDLVPDTNHYYRIRAKSEYGYSDWSDMLSITTKNEPPAKIENIYVSSDNERIKVRWDKVPEVDYYEVQFGKYKNEEVLTDDHITNEDFEWGPANEVRTTYCIKSDNDLKRWLRNKK